MGAPSRRRTLCRVVGWQPAVQTWLRMREEFGLTGEESGEIVRWAIEVLAREARDGHLPE